MKPRSIQNIEARMQGLEAGSLRYQALDSARDFKSSWIALGQNLSSIYRDKLYREWGYLTFEAYCAKEIGVRQSTAVKLVKSYFFLEKEEPAFLRPESLGERTPDRIPGLESVNALRLAKDGARLSEKEYDTIREEVFENPKEDEVVKKKIRYLLKSRSDSSDSDGDAASTALKKLFLYLQNSRKSMTSLSLPNKIIKKIDELLELLEDYGK